VEIGLVVAGFAVGMLIGLSGMGGGALMAPFLIGVVGMRPLHAVGTDLLFSVVTKLFGAYRHRQLGTVDRAVVGRLALGSVPGVLAGVFVLERLEAHGEGGADRFVLHGLGFVLILVALALGWRVLRPAPPTPARTPAGWLLAPAAALLGFLVGVTSVGSGSLFVVLLTFATALPVHRVVGTDIAHAALLTGVGAAAHLSIGTVDLGITTALLAGSLPGVWLGSGLSARLPRRALSGVVATVLFATGLRLI
jgi:uncharacterized membrane protein YfcA